MEDRGVPLFPRTNHLAATEHMCVVTTRSSGQAVECNDNFVVYIEASTMTVYLMIEDELLCDD